MRSSSTLPRPTSALRAATWWAVCGLALTSQACAGCDDDQGPAQLVDNNATTPDPDTNNGSTGTPTGQTSTTPAPVWPAYLIVEVEPSRFRMDCVKPEVCDAGRGTGLLPPSENSPFAPRYVPK